jgi:hypothetical protein
VATRHRRGPAWLVGLALGLAAGCGGGSGASPMDLDGDGYSSGEGDCDDDDRAVFPGAPDPCDGVDQNCDGTADEMFDADGDGFATCAGDCRDNDPAANPAELETIDGLDNDCDGIADNHTAQFDDDGDGYSEDQGDCNDDPNADGALVGPDAIEVAENADGDPEQIDNDCDGAVDEGEPPCPTDLPRTSPMAFAAALDVCNQVSDARWTGADVNDPRARGIFTSYGSAYTPHAGPDFVVLSTGIAGDHSNPDTNLGYANHTDHPEPLGATGCSEADPSEVNDYSEVQLVLDVPANANSFSFDFNFMSKEFPEFVCSDYDDTFLAMLDSQEFTGNVSFDAQGNRVSINVGFFDKCDVTLDPVCTGDEELVGTGFQNSVGGGTGWLTTTAPVTPGEKITLTFAIFDEGDHILDSAVLIDNFRWHIEQVDGPVTVE